MGSPVAGFSALNPVSRPSFSAPSASRSRRDSLRTRSMNSSISRAARRSAPRGRGGHGMLRREGEKRRAEEGVRPRREYPDGLGEPLDRGRESRAPSERPIQLRCIVLTRSDQSQPVEPLEQALGVVGDTEEPLRQVADLDEVVGALAAAVDDLFVGEHRAAARTPVHRRRLAVREAALPHPQEQPLVPAVVTADRRTRAPWTSRRDSPALELLLHPPDVASVYSRGWTPLWIAAFSAGSPKASQPMGLSALRPAIRSRRYSASPRM